MVSEVNHGAERFILNMSSELYDRVHHATSYSKHRIQDVYHFRRSECDMGSDNCKFAEIHGFQHRDRRSCTLIAVRSPVIDTGKHETNKS